MLVTRKGNRISSIIQKLACFSSTMASEKQSKRELRASSEEKNNLTFVSQSNPITGKIDWVMQNENYDYIQEIARSGYGDMLHDKDRNEKYFLAIRQAVKLLKSRGKDVHVLDIGTGTGLLSMMACEAGADTVTACEAFQPMANCAKKVIMSNGLQDKIKLVNKRSLEMKVEDISQKANLLVTELFDTELIGEGAIGSYTDAHNRFMQEECVAVPSSSRMYIQAVGGDVLRNWNGLQPVDLPNGSTIQIPQSLTTCSFNSSMFHDLQVDQLQNHLSLISEPIQVFQFDFSHRNALPFDEKCIKKLEALQDGTILAFVMWWDLQMDPQGEITLSCGPSWTRPTNEDLPWRDHWLQALYYPSQPLDVKKHETFAIHCQHDEYSLSFDVIPENSDLPSVNNNNQLIAFSRSRLGQLNNRERNQIFIKTLEKHIISASVCLVISDGCLLPLIAAKLGAKKVFYKDTNLACMRVVKELIEANKMESKIVVLEKDTENLTSEDFHHETIDIVIAEPFSQVAHLPWEHLYFWYCLPHIRQHLSPDVLILPRSMDVKALAVEFRDLYKIRAPVGTCEGFDISHFDKLIESASNEADEEIEPQSLWEYPCKALSEPTTLMTLNFSENVHDKKPVDHTSSLACCRSGNLNGVAFWTEFNFGDGLHYSNGLSEPVQSNAYVKWDLFSRQGVGLLRHARQISTDSSIDIDVEFQPETADFKFLIN